MTEFFRFTIELKTQIQDTPRGDGNEDIFERVQRLARKILKDKQMVTEVYKIIFIDLLLGDYYSDVLRHKLNLKKEREIILPVSIGLESSDSDFFEMLFREPLKKEILDAKDNSLNLLFSQFGTPVITDVRLEPGNTKSVKRAKKGM